MGAATLDGVQMIEVLNHYGIPGVGHLSDIIPAPLVGVARNASPQDSVTEATMDTAFRVGYSLVVAILLVLFVIFGIRTVDDGPDRGTSSTPVSYERYQDREANYHRDVFVVAGAIGVAAVAAGLYLYRRLQAIPLGLLLGGIGIVNFGWIQAAENFDEIGEGQLFAVLAAGLAIVLATGYWFLGTRRVSDSDSG